MIALITLESVGRIKEIIMYSTQNGFRSSGGGRPVSLHRNVEASGGGGVVSRHQSSDVRRSAGSEERPYGIFSEYFSKLNPEEKALFTRSFCDHSSASGNKVDVYYGIIKSILTGFKEFSNGNPELEEQIELLKKSIDLEHYSQISILLNHEPMIDTIKELKSGQGIPVMVSYLVHDDTSHAVQYLFKRDGDNLTISLINTGYGAIAQSSTHRTCYSFSIDSFFRNIGNPSLGESLSGILRSFLSEIRNIGFQDINGHVDHNRLETVFRAFFRNNFTDVIESQIDVPSQRGGSCLYSSWNAVIDRIFGQDIANTIRFSLMSHLQMLVKHGNSDLEGSRDEMLRILEDYQERPQENTQGVPNSNVNINTIYNSNFNIRFINNYGQSNNSAQPYIVNNQENDINVGIFEGVNQNYSNNDVNPSQTNNSFGDAIGAFESVPLIHNQDHQVES